MANVQVENGYTRIANEILEELAKVPLNGTQFRIINVLWRSTYGFNKKFHELSEGFIAKATEIHKKQIQRELGELIKLNIVLVIEDATFCSSRKLQFNKDYESWQVTKKIPPIQKDTHTGNFLVTSPGSGLVTQKRNIQINIKKDTQNHFFESLWKMYPNKKGKGKISDTQKAKLYKTGFEEMIRAIERYSSEIRGRDTQYIQHGSSFFNKGYLDYLDSNYQDSKAEQPKNQPAENYKGIPASGAYAKRDPTHEELEFMKAMGVPDGY